MIFRKSAILATAAIALSAVSAVAFADSYAFDEPYWQRSLGTAQAHASAPAAMDRLTKTDYDLVDRYNP